MKETVAETHETKALAKAKRRERKRRPKMKVSGKAVFTLAKLMRKPRQRHRRAKS